MHWGWVPDQVAVDWHTLCWSPDNMYPDMQLYTAEAPMLVLPLGNSTAPFSMDGRLPQSMTARNTYVTSDNCTVEFQTRISNTINNDNHATRTRFRLAGVDNKEPTTKYSTHIPVQVGGLPLHTPRPLTSKHWRRLSPVSVKPELHW